MATFVINTIDMECTYHLNFDLWYDPLPVLFASFVYVIGSYFQQQYIVGKNHVSMYNKMVLFHL